MTDNIIERKALLKNEIQIAKGALKENIDNVELMFDKSANGQLFKGSKFNLFSILTAFIPKSSFLGKIVTYYKAIKALI